MNSLNPKKVGLAIGTFYAFFHAVWVLMVAVGIAKPLLDWILGLHFFALTYSINTFQIVPALLLIAVTFVSGYVIGWIFAALWNAFNR